MCTHTRIHITREKFSSGDDTIAWRNVAELDRGADGMRMARRIRQLDCSKEKSPNVVMKNLALDEEETEKETALQEKVKTFSASPTLPICLELIGSISDIQGTDLENRTEQKV